MGLDRTIRFSSDETPTWDAIRRRLSLIGASASLRLIDGLPAFPDELPADDWKELRIGMAAGMVTIRRGAGRLTCVIWANAGQALEEDWRRVTWACAAAGDGLIDGADGTVTADEFARSEKWSPE